MFKNVIVVAYIYTIETTRHERIPFPEKEKGRGKRRKKNLKIKRLCVCVSCLRFRRRWCLPCLCIWLWLLQLQPLSLWLVVASPSLLTTVTVIIVLTFSTLPPQLLDCVTTVSSYPLRSPSLPNGTSLSPSIIYSRFVADISNVRFN